MQANHVICEVGAWGLCKGEKKKSCKILNSNIYKTYLTVQNFTTSMPFYCFRLLFVHSFRMTGDCDISMCHGGMMSYLTQISH